MTKSIVMMIHLIITLPLFTAPSSGGAFPSQRLAEIAGLSPFAMQVVYRQHVDKIASRVTIGRVLVNVPVIRAIPDSVS